MKTKLVAAILLFVLGLEPSETLGAETPPAPDYTKVESWAVLPGESGDAEATPAGVSST